ncbi:MAG: alpha/beta fold hydrolase [Gemmatimonadaceae bacterium]
MRIETRTIAVLLATLSVAGGVAPASAQSRHTYVIVHGAWGGAWDWRAVDSMLTARGQRVHRVTLTGLGERVHLASPNIGLTTHITDVVNAISFERLKDVVLVGHSYGGMVITGVADRIPERVRALIYLDAFLPESGETVLKLVGADGASFFTQNTKDGLIIPPWVTPESTVPKDVPHPLKTFTDTLTLTNQEARRLPASYILTVDKGATQDGFSPYAARAKARGWPVHQMEADHTPERSARSELVQLLLRVP